MCFYMARFIMHVCTSCGWLLWKAEWPFVALIAEIARWINLVAIYIMAVGIIFASANCKIL